MSPLLRFAVLFSYNTSFTGGRTEDRQAVTYWT